MLNQDITLGTSVYSLITQRATSSLRSDASRALDLPVSLTVAHETASSGRISSAAYLDSDEVVEDANGVPSTDTVRVMLKLQYNPLSGRTTTETELLRLRDQVIAFISDATNWDKMLNKES